MSQARTVSTTQTTEVNRRPNAWAPATVVARLVWFVASVAILLLVIRFLFILFRANSANSFVNFIYTISYPLARPFFGIFNYHTHYGFIRFEWASLVAIAIYAIAAFLLVRLVSVARPTTTTTPTDTTV